MGFRDRRDRRQDEREGSGPGGSASRYVMRQKLLAFGDDYWIENGDGDKVFKVDGKALRVRETLHIEDARGTQLCRLQTRVLHVRDTMAIEFPDGSPLATVHKALITPLRERWRVDVEAGDDLEIQGNVVDHEYRIECDGHKVAEVSKRWFRFRDTYGLQVATPEHTLIVVAAAVALDVMTPPAG